MTTGFLFGAPGALIALPDAQGTLSVTDGPAVTISRLLGGGQYATITPASRREWRVSIPAMTALEASRLQVLLRAVPAPYAWLSVWAMRVNALTPDQTLFTTYPEGAIPGPLVECVDGVLAPSVSLGGAVTTLTYADDVVCTPATTVTASVHARPFAGAAPRLYLRFLNAAGGIVDNSARSTTVSGSGPLQRISHTATAPAGTVSVQLRVDDAAIVAAPALTFTSALTPWGVGDGCARSVVSGYTSEPSSASAWDESLSDISFTVTEVG